MTKFLTAFIFTTLLASLSFAQNKIQNAHPLSGLFTLTAEGGVTYSQTDFKNSQIGPIGRLDVDYFFPTSSEAAFGLKLFGGYGIIKGDGGATKKLPNFTSFKTPLYFIGFGPEFSYAIGNVVPYLFAGLSYLHFNPEDSSGHSVTLTGAGAYSKNEVNYNLEFGIRFLASQSVTINAAAMAHISPNDNLDNVPNYLSGGLHNDQFYTFSFGISYNFGSSSSNDQDGDGVPDNIDLCPNTPKGVVVNEFGCPIDSDHDGVPDYLDKCANTPLGVKVDKEGCPLDSDEDGVPDYKDKCPNTPLGVAVDKAGCPLDSDHDGVPDYLDKCPGTKPGVKVDSHGCPVSEMQPEQKPKTETPQNKETKELTLSGEANFEFGKAVLTPNAKKVLDNIIQTLKNNPGTKWRIEGYSDNVGSYDANKKISLKRAQAVLNYFVQKGLNPSRFEIYAYGPDNPIATNKTEYGRALNRRVTIKEVGAPETKTPTNVQFNIVKDPSAYNYSNDRIVKGTVFTDGNLFSIQMSSWSTPQKAEQEIIKLRDKGHNAMMFKATVNGQEKYRVRIGFFKTEREAEAYISKYFASGRH